MKVLRHFMTRAETIEDAVTIENFKKYVMSKKKDPSDVVIEFMRSTLKKAKNVENLLTWREVEKLLEDVGKPMHFQSFRRHDREGLLKHCKITNNRGRSVYLKDKLKEHFKTWEPYSRIKNR